MATAVDELVAAFEAAREEAGPAPDAAQLAALVQRAQAARPQMALDARALAQHVAAQPALCRDPTAIATVHAGDLALAVAALAGDPTAARVLDAEAIAPLRASLTRICRDPARADDVLQDLRQGLLAGERPKLCTYSGLGPLGAWIRMCAVREAMRQTRKDTREVPFSAELLEQIDASIGTSSPTASIRAGLESAVREAFATLPARQRAVMQMYYRDGAELAEIGRVYGVHLSTISRWLAHGRKLVSDNAYATLQARLRLTRSEARSLLGFAEEVDANMASLLSLGRSGRDR